MAKFDKLRASRQNGERKKPAKTHDVVREDLITAECDLLDTHNWLRQSLLKVQARRCRMMGINI